MSAEQPGLRPSNADREPYEQALAQAVADGRLDQETFEGRLVDVAEATSRAALDRAVRDVPFAAHAEQAARSRRSSRRRFVLGLAGLGVVGGAAYWATRQWPDPVRAEVPADGPSPAPQRPTVSSGTVATSMVQVPVRQAEMFPIMVEHLLSEKVTRLSDLYVFDTSVNVEGVRDGRPVAISYDADEAPSLTVLKGQPRRSIPVERIRELDIADVIARTRKLVDVGPTPRIDVEYEDEWRIRVSDEDRGVDWDLTGRRRIG